jgi:hypothetical protein
MAEIKAKKCAICNQTVNVLSSYAQVALGKLAHLQCVRDESHKKGYEQGQCDLLAEQEAKREREEVARKNREAQMLADAEARRAKEERERRKAEEQRLVNLRYRVDQLPRCSGCGKRVNVAKLHRTPMTIEEVREVEPDAVEPSSGYDAGGRCRNCAESERLARNEARRPGAPKDDEKKPEEKRDRFGVIEIE